MITMGFAQIKEDSRDKQSPSKFFYMRTENFDGKSCEVYRVFLSALERENRGGPWTVWIDGQTHYPVSIGCQTQFGALTFGNFQWNLPLDDSQFNQDIPKGFQITNDWVDAWAQKLEASRPLPPRKPDMTQKRDLGKQDDPGKTAAPARAVPK